MTPPWPMFYDREGKPISLEEMCDGKFGSPEYQQVAVWGDAGDELIISTVWLGIDHNFHRGEPDHVPIIFETMIFGYGKGNHSVRYATETEALVGHHQAVEDVEAGRMPWFIEGRPIHHKV